MKIEKIMNESIETRENPMKDARNNIYTVGDKTFYIAYADGKLFAGTATNTGIFHDHEIVYDWDESLDDNIKNLIALINEKESIMTESKVVVTRDTVTEAIEDYDGEIDLDDPALYEDYEEEETAAEYFHRLINEDLQKEQKISDSTMKMLNEVRLTARQTADNNYEIVNLED